MKAQSLSAKLSIVALLIAGSSAAADKKPAPESNRETIAKPLSEKERRKREDTLRKELEGAYRKWLSEDVGYIITDEERQSFKRLANDDERQSFIESFWLRRDPTPDSAENEFKEEHYR
ncbi:MAG TPA: GWxTD domain-containing protein, partial [Bryobacteraceae bacterium]|nr:GWxTD domain-containing protein [Bryobacteraceae bacterium]